tara:strand:- start:349 stop:561 length:213 start_codon:yes stop_codon:yes gene_type:complete
MAIYNLTQKTVGRKGKLVSTGQKITSLGGGLNPSTLNRIQNLEDKVTSQSERLEHIVKLLNELSEKKSAS